MSDRIGLGEADANARWIGIRRHQAVLVIVGVGLLSDWVLARRAPLGEALAGLVVLASAAPSFDGHTVGEQFGLALGYATRSHWWRYDVREFGDDVVLFFGGEVALRGYELVHYGRLDLSGRDVALAEALGALADGASAARSGQHFSEHVVTTPDATATLLCLPIGATAPSGWEARSALALEVLGAVSGAPVQLLERFTYLRTRGQLARVFRVRDFSSVPPTRGLLEGLLRAPVPFDLALHVDIVAGEKAQRVASRAVHRVGSDDTTTRSAGFRRTAHSTRNFERLAQRELLVANGRSLLRLATFVVVRGSTYADLQRRSAAVWRLSHDAGLRLERGWGRQGSWYRSQLPGGPGW